MASKIEEIYPPHINLFSESTSDSVTSEEIIEQELKVCDILGWNFNGNQTMVDWTTWFMQRWDDYVDESLSYLKHQFHLKFLEGNQQSHGKYLTLMNYIDLLAISFESKRFNPRILIACVMYLIIGGKDIMCAFQH